MILHLGKWILYFFLYILKLNFQYFYILTGIIGNNNKAVFFKQDLWFLKTTDSQDIQRIFSASTP